MRSAADAERTAGSPGEPLDLDGRLCGDASSLDDFARVLGRRAAAGQPHDDAAGFLPRRINTDRARAEQDLARLVLALVDLVRQLMERQAVRRVNAGSLRDDEVERMGETFLALDRRMTELRTAFGVTREELDLSLGSIRDLL